MKVIEYKHVKEVMERMEVWVKTEREKIKNKMRGMEIDREEEAFLRGKDIVLLSVETRIDAMMIVMEELSKEVSE